MFTETLYVCYNWIRKGLTMDTAIIVVIISSFVSLFSTLIMWCLNRKAKKEDDRKIALDTNSLRFDKIDHKVDKLYDIVNGLGNKVNEALELQNVAIEGLCWSIDGLEKAKILNGHGLEYLNKINGIYKNKGMSAMKFESLVKKEK